jgi:hypothetical protein
MNMEQTECSETSAYKTQTPENYPEESIQHSEHGESLKSRITPFFLSCKTWVKTNQNMKEDGVGQLWCAPLGKLWFAHVVQSRTS